MNLLEALKQISEKTDKDDRSHFIPPDEGKAGNFPIGYPGTRSFGSPDLSSLLMEMHRQTIAAQQGPPQTLLKDVRYNPEAVARFIREQDPSLNIEDRRKSPKISDEEQMDPNNFDPRLLDAPPLRRDPFDPLAQLLGINSIGPQATTVPENIPLPRPRPRR